MTDDEIKREVNDIADQVEANRRRIEELEEETEALSRVPEAVAELKGAVLTLSGLVNRVSNGADRIEKANSVKTAIQFAAIVIVPILVALLGGYFVIRAGAPSGR